MEPTKMNRDAAVPASGETEDDPVLIIGDFYPGAYGPTIILFLKSIEAANWLRDVFEEVVRLPAPKLITNDPHMRVTGLTDLALVCRGEGPEIELRTAGRDDPPSFLWSATTNGWRHLIGLMGPFCDGHPGHQYLTREGIDDALVEVSLDERQGEWPPVPAPQQTIGGGLLERVRGWLRPGRRGGWRWLPIQPTSRRGR
jgi:hypothetical protein